MQGKKREKAKVTEKLTEADANAVGYVEYEHPYIKFNLSLTECTSSARNPGSFPPKVGDRLPKNSENLADVNEKKKRNFTAWALKLQKWHNATLPIKMSKTQHESSHCDTDLYHNRVHQMYTSI